MTKKETPDAKSGKKGENTQIADEQDGIERPVISDDIVRDAKARDEKKIAEVRASLGIENKPEREQSEAAMQENFGKFLKLNGERLSQTDPDNDFVDDVIKKMGLSGADKKALVDFVDDYIKTNKESGGFGGGLFILNRNSIESFQGEKRRSAEQAEITRRARLSPEQRMAEDADRATRWKKQDDSEGSPRKKSKPPEYIIPTDGGDIKGSIVYGQRGGPGVVRTSRGMINVNKLP